MATMTITGTGVTVSINAPSFPPSMSGDCENFRSWPTGDPQNPTVILRSRWSAAGVEFSSEVSNVSWITVDGFSNGYEVPGAGVMSVA